MKTPPLTNGSPSINKRRTNRRTATLLLASALATTAMFPGTSLAEVIDDFEDPAKTQQIWTSEVLNGIGGYEVTGGHARLFVTSTADHGFSTLFSVRRWTLQQDRTLEFRADLVGSNGDGAVGYVAFALGDGTRMYTLGMDQDTIALAKRASPEQLFLLTNGVPVKGENVKLVLSMTGARSGVLLRFRVLDNNRDGEVLFERDYWDTPASDPLQRGVDVPPQNYLGESGLFELSVYHDNAGSFDPEVDIPPRGLAEVIFDNVEVLEYSTWIAGPQPVACLPSWPENTAEEQILVSADSLEGPWTPWPEPIFKRHGEYASVVLLTNNPPQRFLKLAPGTQFIEDFDPPQPPYTGKGAWVPNFFDASDAARWEVINTAGALRIRTLQPPADGRVMIPLPGTDVVTPSGMVVADFYASVDIREWTANGQATFGLSARGQIGAGYPQNSNGYIGAVWLNPSKITIWNGEMDVPAPGLAFTFDPSADYRLVFSGVGPNLLLRLENLTTGEIAAQMSYVSSRWSQGFMGLYVGEGPGVLRDITIDNYFMTGTKP